MTVFALSMSATMKILNAESVLKAMSGTSASHVLLYSAIAYTGLMTDAPIVLYSFPSQRNTNNDSQMNLFRFRAQGQI